MVYPISVWDLNTRMQVLTQMRAYFLLINLMRSYWDEKWKMHLFTQGTNGEKIQIEYWAVCVVCVKQLAILSFSFLLSVVCMYVTLKRPTCLHCTDGRGVGPEQVVRSDDEQHQQCCSCTSSTARHWWPLCTLGRRLKALQPYCGLTAGEQHRGKSVLLHLSSIKFWLYSHHLKKCGPDMYCSKYAQTHHVYVSNSPCHSIQLFCNPLSQSSCVHHSNDFYWGCFAEVTGMGLTVCGFLWRDYSFCDCLASSEATAHLEYLQVLWFCQLVGLRLGNVCIWLKLKLGDMTWNLYHDGHK